MSCFVCKSCCESVADQVVLVDILLVVWVFSLVDSCFSVLVFALVLGVDILDVEQICSWTSQHLSRLHVELDGARTRHTHTHTHTHTNTFTYTGRARVFWRQRD